MISMQLRIGSSLMTVPLQHNAIDAHRNELVTTRNIGEIGNTLQVAF